MSCIYSLHSGRGGFRASHCSQDNLLNVGLQVLPPWLPHPGPHFTLHFPPPHPSDDQALPPHRPLLRLLPRAPFTPPPPGQLLFVLWVAGQTTSSRKPPRVPSCSLMASIALQIPAPFCAHLWRTSHSHVYMMICRGFRVLSHPPAPLRTEHPPGCI